MENIWKDIFPNSGTSLSCVWTNNGIDLSLDGDQYKPKVSVFYCSQNLAKIDYNQYYIMNGFVVNSVITVKKKYNLIKKQANEVKFEPEALWYLSPDVVPKRQGQDQFDQFLGKICPSIS